MKNAFKQIKKYWLSNLITFLVSLTIGIVIFCLIFFLRNRLLLDAVNGLTAGGVIVLFLGLLCWMAFLGVFDVFSFGFKQLLSTVFSKDPRRDGSYTNYKERKTAKREASSYYFVPIIAAGLVLIIALIIVFIVYKVSL